MMQDVLKSAEISTGLLTKVMGKNIVLFSEVDSTNDVAKKMEKEGAQDGTLICAEIQNAGKGRRGNIWESGSADGIYMSLIVRPAMEVAFAPQITLLVAIAICKAIRKQTKLEALIKWPNDILIENKKVCGILTELELVAEETQIRGVVIGVGVNVNNESFPPTVADIATSLKIQSGQHVERKEIIRSFLQEFEAIYLQYIKEKEFKRFLTEYKSFCHTLLKEIKVTRGSTAFFGKAIDITNNGELVVSSNEGNVIVNAGEVSVRLFS